MAKPPVNGVGIACCLRPPGWSTSPQRNAAGFRAGIRNAVATNARTKPIADLHNTRSLPSDGRFGYCNAAGADSRSLVWLLRQRSKCDKVVREVKAIRAGVALAGGALAPGKRE